jgi:ribosome biogenesis GTPase A
MQLTANKINHLLEQKLNSKELRIAIAGEFSSGKSTLINALLHKDLLKHSSYETTVITIQLFNVRKNDTKCRTIEIVKKDGTTKEANFKDLVALTTTSGDHSSVSQIKEINIYLHYLDTEVPVVILDTPGLNSIADFHREEAIKAVLSSHVCVYTLPRPYLSHTDRDFFNQVSKYQTNFIFCVGFLDSINNSLDENVDKNNPENNSNYDPENDTDMKKLTAQIQKAFPDLEFEVIRVSALKALAGRDKSIKKVYFDDTEEITHRRRSELVDESNIKPLEDMLKKYIDNATEIKYSASKQAMITVLQKSTEEIVENVTSDLTEEYLGKLGVDDRYLAESEKELTKRYAVKIRTELLQTLRSADNPDLKEANVLYEKLVRDYREKIRAEIGIAKQDLIEYIKKTASQQEDIQRQIALEEEMSSKIPYYDLSSFSKIAVTDSLSEFFADIPDTAEIRDLIGSDDILIIPGN